MKPIPPYPDTAELVAMLNNHETTSVAVVGELLRRADAAESLNAFITLDADGALARAAELDELRAGNTILGPLHGIPLVVKDNIHVAGLPNTAGTPALSEFTPQIDNAVVAALKNAGAIILGKTNMHELAFGITSDNAAFGAVANPFDQTMFPGGSSGGTASAIAAGLVSAGLGTDTGGSVRIPAALTGIVGFRPSTDQLDSTAVTPISHTRDTVGFMARSVSDIVLLYEATGTAGRQIDNTVSISDIRLGIPRAYYYNNADEAALVVIEAALAKLGVAGVTFVEANPPELGDLIAKSAFPIALYEVMKDLPEYLHEFATANDLVDVANAAASPDVQGLFASLLDDGQIPEDVYVTAMAAREELRVVFRNYFANNDLDAMIFPTTLLPARPIEGSLQTVSLNGEQVPTFPSYIHNTDPASIAALPGISLPIGVTADGLPIGIEIDGPEGSDRRVLQIAIELEKVFEFSARP